MKKLNVSWPSFWSASWRWQCSMLLRRYSQRTFNARYCAGNSDVAQWTVELGKNQNLTLTLGFELTDGEQSAASLLSMLRMPGLFLRWLILDAVNKRKSFFWLKAKQGKTVALVPVTFTSEIEVTMILWPCAYAALRPDVQSNMEGWRYKSDRSALPLPSRRNTLWFSSWSANKRTFSKTCICLVEQSALRGFFSSKERTYLPENNWKI